MNNKFFAAVSVVVIASGIIIHILNPDNGGLSLAIVSFGIGWALRGILEGMAR